jgi:plastocyanin
MLQVRTRALPAVLLLGALASACSSAVPAAAPTEAPGASPAVTSAAPTRPAATSPSPAPTSAIILVSPEPSAPISNVKITLVSFGAKFSPVALTAPANERWHLSFDLQDRLGVHNFTISSGPSVYERVYATPKVGFGLHEFVVDGLPAGMYRFVCTLHADTMKGTIDIR